MEYESNELVWKWFRMECTHIEKRKKIWKEEDEVIEISYVWIPLTFYERGERLGNGIEWWGREHQILSWYQQEETDWLELDLQQPRVIDFVTQMEEKMSKMIQEHSEQWFHKKMTIHQLDSLVRSAVRWNNRQNSLSIRVKYQNGIFPEEIRKEINPQDRYSVLFRITGCEIYQQSWNLLIEIERIMKAVDGKKYITYEKKEKEEEEEEKIEWNVEYMDQIWREEKEEKKDEKEELGKVEIVWKGEEKELDPIEELKRAMDRK